MRRLLSMVVALSCASLVAQAEVPSYRVQFLGAGWTGTAINEQGDICGNVSPDGTLMLAGISRQGQPFESLPLPPGMQSSRAHDLNDAGVIVGAVCPNQYVVTQPTAAVWRPVAGGGYETEVLGALPGDPFSAAYAVNNRGDIIGASGFWGWNLSTGVLFTAAGPVRLAEDLLAADVNDERVVIGGNRLLDLDTGVTTTVPLPPGNWQGTMSTAINNNDDFCGYIAGYSSCSLFPLRYRHGPGWEFLGSCAQTATSATAINDRGDVLSYYYMTTAGVTFVDEGYFMLGSLIAPGQGEIYIQYGGANGINNSRQIVAAARQGSSGPIGAILMTPVGSSAIEVATAPPSAFRVLPNPSSGTVTLDGPDGALAGVEWGVFTAAGRQCARFSGRSWDGRASAGDRVPAGVYFIRPLHGGAGPVLRLIRE